MTTSTLDEYVLDVASCAEAQAWTTANNYKGFVDRDDLVQEAWVWMLEHEQQIETYKQHEEPRLAYYWLSRDLWKVMDRYARKGRAQVLGYDPADEAFYGKAVLDTLLPAVLNGDPIQPQGEVQEVRSSKDPAEGGTYLAMYIDVQQALKKTELSDRERSILKYVYGDGYSQKEAGDLLGVGQPAIAKQVKKIYAKLVKNLGGEYPPETGPDRSEKVKS